MRVVASRGARGEANPLDAESRGRIMNVARPVALVVLLVLPSIPTVCFGDTVFTSDGSKLVGKIEQMAGGKLKIASALFGHVEIDSSQIVAFEFDEPLTVEFESGDRLVGTMAAGDEQRTSTMRTALGALDVSAGQIKSMWPPGSESPELAAVKAEAAETKRAYAPEWKSTFEAGGSRKEGNTDTLDARGRFDLRRKTAVDMLHFYLAAEYSEQNDSRTTNEYRGGMNYEYTIDDHWSWYARMELEFDEFEDLDLRATAASGGTYYWLKKPHHELKNRFGAGYRHEAYQGDRTNDSAVIDLGLDYRLDVVPWARFTHSTTYSPDFEEFNDYRLDLDTALLIPFKDDRFKLKVGMRNEYNSSPQPGFDRLDNTYYANIVVELP